MIFFECFADESLLRHVGFSKKDLSGGHSFGRSRVSARLRVSQNALAIIDEDPEAPRDQYLEYLFGLQPIHADRYCIAIVDLKRNNRVIIIRPDLEAWSVRIAKDMNIDLTDYDLVNNHKKLHDILRVERNEGKRKRFVEFMNDIEGHSAIVKLKELMNQK